MPDSAHSALSNEENKLGFVSTLGPIGSGAGKSLEETTFS